MEKKNLNSLLKLIKESGYDISKIDVNYSTRYCVPRHIELHINSFEYNEAVLNDEKIPETRKRYYLD
jgi:hypothetical protein